MTPPIRNGNGNQLLPQTPTIPPNKHRGPQSTPSATIQTWQPEVGISLTGPNEPVADLHGREIFQNFGILSYSKDEMLIIDSNGSVIFRFVPNDPNVTTVLDFEETAQKCKLILEIKNENEIQLADISIPSKEMTIIATPRNDDQQKDWWTGPNLSPSGKYVSYVVWSGEQFYDSAQYQDIEILEMGGNARQRITTHGGAWKSNGAWSPNEDIFAYSDFDSFGISQLYIYSMAQKEQQLLTDFTQSKDRISTITWSPEGNKIIYVLVKDYWLDTQRSELWLVDLKHNHNSRLVLPDPPNGIGEKIYWDTKGSQVFLNLMGGEKEFLYWLDIENGTSSRILRLADLEKINQGIGSFVHPFPFAADNSVVGFVSDEKIFRYDLTTGKVTAITIESLSSELWLIDRVKPLKYDFSNCVVP